MKKLILSIFALIFLLSFVSSATFVYDDFSDNFINNTLWRNVTTGTGTPTTTETSNRIQAQSTSGGGGQTAEANITAINLSSDLTQYSTFSIETHLFVTTGTASGTYLARFIVFGNTIAQVDNGGGTGTFQENVNWSFNRTSTNSFDVYKNGAFNKSFTATNSNVTIHTRASGGVNEVGRARIFSFNYTTPELSNSLNFPSNNSYHINNSIIFNATASPNGIYNLSNATIFIWYSNQSLLNTSTVSLSGSTNNNSVFNISNIPPGVFLWNVLSCGTNVTTTQCVYALNNNTFNKGYILNSESHNSPVIELSSQVFTLNVTLQSGLSSSQATFRYNNTNYVASSQTVGPNTIYTATVTVPDVSTSTNIIFNWSLALVDTLGSNTFQAFNGTQTVNVISIDDCSVNTLQILNYTLRDEGTQSIPTVSNATNTSIELEVTLSSLSNPNLQSIFNKSYSNTNPARVCLAAGTLGNSSYRLDAIARYSYIDHVVEFHNIQNYSLTNTSGVQNINLYDLASADSQEFLITFKDGNFLPVKDALIDIQRKYISEGVFKSVEIPKTDSKGQTIGHFVISDAIYSIKVYKNGILLATFDNVRAICENQATGDCKINLNTFSSSSSPSSFATDAGLTYNFAFNKNTRTVTVTFSTLSGSSSGVSLNTTRFDRFGNQTVCTDLLSSSSGTLTCVVPQSFGNLTILSTLYNNGNFVAQATYKVAAENTELTSGTKAFLMMLLFLTIPMFFISNPVGVLLGAMFAMIFGGLLLVIDTGSFFGEASVIGWFAVAIIILIIRISRRNNT